MRKERHLLRLLRGLFVQQIVVFDVGFHLLGLLPSGRALFLLRHCKGNNDLSRENDSASTQQRSLELCDTHHSLTIAAAMRCTAKIMSQTVNKCEQNSLCTAH